MKKKALITGGAGTVGFFLAKALAEQGYTVILADNFSRGVKDQDLNALIAKHPNISLLTFDVTDRTHYDRLDRDIDYVYHLAAVNGTRNFYERPQEVLRVGVQGMLYMLEWFRLVGYGKLLFTSSNEAYAGTITLTGGPLPTPETVPLCISDVMNPRWSYGGSKLIGELLCVNYARAYHFPMSIVRYHNSYGPRMGYDHVIPEFFMRLRRREDPFVINGGKETRAFCYIDDTVRATQLVMESSATNGEIVHIGNDQEEIAIVDLAQKMFTLAGYAPSIDVRTAPAGSVSRRCPDISKIKRLVGFTPTVSLDQGLQKTWDWYVAHEKATHP